MLRFNSTTVQLIPRDSQQLLEAYRRFNSTTVQLIHIRNAHKAWTVLFQFHNGTINTRSASSL